MKVNKKAPDYSAYQHKFEFYCYTPPNDGKWVDRDGNEHEERDFRTVEKYKEYRDCGFDILMMQSAGKYEGEDWETSNAKAVSDRVMAAGIKKIIMTDIRLQKLSAVEGGLIGEGKTFATEAELDEHVAACMAPYRAYPGFYGVQLRDEPTERHRISYGQMYRSIKRVCPNAFIQMCMNQIYTTADCYNKYRPVEGEFKTEEEEGCARYDQYISDFIDCTGADYMMFDTYPLKGPGIREPFIYNMQAFARICTQKGVRPVYVTQTESEIHVSNGAVKMRKVDERGARWLNNMILGFGAKQIVYYTYFCKGWQNSSFYPDDASFITHKGAKTELYHFMKRILAENQRFAPVILNFDYVTSRMYCCSPTSHPTHHVKLRDKFDGFKVLKEATINQECALVTELYDKANDRYMYMAQNVVDPQFVGDTAYQKCVLDFGEDYTRAALFVNGEREDVDLEGGKLTLWHNPGEATFVIPY